MKLFLKITIFSLFSACGAGSNVNKMWGKDEDSTSAKMEKARLAYDRKDFDTAASLAGDVRARNPDYGDASVLLGFIDLAKANLHPLVLARKMALLNSATDIDPDAVRCPKAADSSATEVLRNLACRLLNLTNADYLNLGSVQDLTGVFAGKKIFVPVTLNDDVRSKVSILNLTNRGIKNLCGFVSRDALLPTKDMRHASADCAAKSQGVISKTQVHFLFALFHLVEALVLQGTVLQGNVGTLGTTSLLDLNGQLKNADYGTNIALYASSITSLNTVINQVLQITDVNSQIALLVSNLKTVGKSFAQIPAIPKSVTKKIDDAIAKIDEDTSKIQGAVNDNAALKAQITAKIAAVVSDKMNQIAAQYATSGKTISDSDKASACTSYAAVAAGLPSNSGITKPTFCP